MAMKSRGKAKEKKMVKTLVVGPFRIGFENLLTPEETDSGDKFNLTMLFPPDSKSIPEIEDALFDVMEDAFGPEADWPSGKKDILPEDKFYDAGTKDYPGFKKGWMVLKASSDDAPGVIDADKNEVMSKREVYRGRWARAQIAVTSFDNKAKGCTAYLNHVQLLEHDEAFSGRGNAEDAFDKYSLKDKGRRSRNDDDEDDRGSKSSGRGESRRGGRDDDDRSTRDRDEGRSSRRGRDDDEDAEDDSKDSRRAGRGREGREERDDRGGRSRGRDTRDVRSRDDDEEDAAPRGRSRSREDDDEDVRPSTRKRSRDDDDDDDRRPRSRGRDDDDSWN